MFRLWHHLRTASGWIALAIIAAVIGAPVQETVVSWLKGFGFLQGPSSQDVATMIGDLAAITHSAWFQWVGGGVIGFAVSAWLDRLIRRKQSPQKPDRTTQTTAGAFPRWPDEYRPISVVSKKFIAQQIPLDGYSYTNCEFTNVTLLYNGTTPIQLLGCRFAGFIVSSDNQAVSGTVAMLQGLGVLQRMTVELRGHNAVEAATWETENPNQPHPGDAHPGSTGTGRAS